jgi:hypothetical protein
MTAAGTGPEMESVELNFRQEAPGRYVGEFLADKAGSYLLAVNTGKDNQMLLTGVTVPYSAEFRERETNEALIKSLAGLKPVGGQAGKVIEGQLTKATVEQLVASVDTFRRTLAKAISNEDFWPVFLLIAAGLFLIDVFIRRVTVHFYWITPALAYAYNRVRGRQQPAPPDQRLARLRNRKAAVASQLEERRAAARFEPQPDATAPRDVSQAISDAAGGVSAPPPPAQQPSAAPQAEQDTYTERLLAAKRKARKDQS